MALTNYEQVVRDVLKAGNATTEQGGKLYLDGNMTDVKIASAIVEATYVGEIFRDGQSVTKKYALNAKVGDTVRVPLRTALPSTSRTLAIAGRSGTPGNDGIFNTNKPMIPTTSEVLLYLNQINDQPILMPEISQKMMPLDTVAGIIAQYIQSVVEDRSASILAEILAYNIYRALNGANNIVTTDITQDNAYSKLLNNLNALMDDGDVLTNAHAYSTQGRCIIGRPQFINNIFSRTSGVLVDGGDFAQAMLKDYNFDTKMSDRDYVGNAYRGHTMQFDLQVANTKIWHMAEARLGLAQGALDNVLAIAVSVDANAVTDNIDLGVKMIDAQEIRGMKAQPLNAWGHEAIRKSYLIGNTSLSTSTFSGLGFTEDNRVYPVAPADVLTPTNAKQILVPIYDADMNIIGYQAIANVIKPNGGNNKNGLTKVTLTLTGTADAPVTNATVTVANGKLPTAVTNNSDGTYTFTIGQGTPATVSITASGYQQATVSITAKNSSQSTYAVTKALTASV